MNSQGLNSILANIASLTLLISISSCSKNDVVNVVYQINEYHNNGFHVTFSINNKNQEKNLIETLKQNCRKIIKDRTGKKPFTNINIARI